MAILVSLTGTCNMVTYASEGFEVENPGDGGIMPHSDIIEWRYMEFGNCVFRRQYNCTQQCWLGDWEFYAWGD